MVSRAIGDRRLLKLADILDTVPRSGFNMRSWISPRGNRTGELTAAQAVSVAISEGIAAMSTRVVECGFAGCAIGWATSDKSFRRAGLVLSFDSGDVENGWGAAPRPSLLEDGEIVAHDYDAIGVFFGMPYWHAEAMFGPQSYALGVRPETVANAIRRYVESDYTVMPEAGKYAL